MKKKDGLPNIEDYRLTAVFEDGKLKKKVGIVTDIYNDYVEIKNIETKEYVIKHIS
jgi:hypothetical protein